MCFHVFSYQESNFIGCLDNPLLSLVDCASLVQALPLDTLAESLKVALISVFLVGMVCMKIGFIDVKVSLVS